MRRKLAAVLFADITGYSRLMGADEAGTVIAFKQLLTKDIRPQVRKAQGRIIKTLGDGFLAEFESPVNAVNCALAVQEAAERHRAAAEEDRRLHFRIGINLGDIIFDGNDVAGDAVNIASRLQTLADPDSVLITEAVLRHITGKVKSDFDDIGHHLLKNIAEPVHVFRVVPRRGVPRPEAPLHQSRRPVVAVLPLTSMSGDANQQYFSDGFTEDIITELSRFNMISVIARNSSFVYRDKAADVRKVGRELGAQFVVEGSIRQIDRNIRITAQLIDAPTGRHVWAERYDASLDELFNVQDDVTRRIVATMVPRIELEELESARRRPTGHMLAYDHYLRGKAEYHAARDADSMAMARVHFEEAVKIDPEFARAYCYLSKIENTIAFFAAAGTPLEPMRARAWELTKKAAALDDSDPVTQLSLAWGHLYRREFDAARRHVDRAASLNPNDADLAVDRGTTLLCLGEPETAIELIRSGIRLNPFHGDSYLADLAEAYFVARRYEEMIATFEQIADPSPRFTAWRAAGYAMAGRESEAKRYADQFVSQLRSIWAGDPGAGPAEYVQWVLSFDPYRRREDAEHLARALKLAGVDVR